MVERFITEEPWEWMESYLFGVRLSGGKTYYCGFFGLYDRNLRGFYVLYRPEVYFGSIHHQPEEEIFGQCEGLILLLVPKNELDAKDREFLATWNFIPKVRGRWPKFRSLRPGFHPWYLQEDEVQILTICLEQGLEVARLSLDDPELIRPRRGRFLFRIAEENGGVISWRQRREKIVLPPKEKFNPPPLDELLLRRLAKARLKKGEEIWEFDYFYSPIPISPDPEIRPYYPFLLVLADPQRGVIGQKLVRHEEVYTEAVALVANTILNQKALPARILVRRKEAYELLSSLAEALGAPALIMSAKELLLIDYF